MVDTKRMMETKTMVDTKRMMETKTIVGKKRMVDNDNTGSLEIAI